MGIAKTGITIEFETELRDGPIILNALIAGKFETDPEGRIIAIGLEMWSDKKGKFGAECRWFENGDFFNLMRTTLAEVYEGDIIDALYDRDVSIAEAAADLRNRSLVDA